MNKETRELVLKLLLDYAKNKTKVLVCLIYRGSEIPLVVGGCTLTYSRAFIWNGENQDPPKYHFYTKDKYDTFRSFHQFSLEQVVSIDTGIENYTLPTIRINFEEVK